MERYERNTLSKTVLDRFMRIPLGDDVCQATYIWIDGTGEFCRSKMRTLNTIPKSPQDCPNWSFDGSLTGQAEGSNSDVFIYPVAMFKDPFLGGNSLLILCDTYNFKKKPTDTNHRMICEEAMTQAKEHVPWFAMQQEYTLLDLDKYPFGWPKNGFPKDQGPYCWGRAISDAHYRACLYAGIKLFGSNAKSMPAQWEYQVGPCEGIEMADQLWVSRYILHRVAEDFGVLVTFDPKPLPGEGIGAGCHTNFSTAKMREDNGIMEIEKAIDRLSRHHLRHIKAYDPKEGRDNERRITSLPETASIHDFSAGVANRGCSIRIPRLVAEDRKGYFEDRRPSSNCDPYSVTEAIVRTVCLEE